VDDISRLYGAARRSQVRFAWQTGRRIVEEEQNGALRAAHGSALIQQLSNALTQKHGPGFSQSNLRKMRHFYLLHQKQSMSTELDWSDYVELLPVKDEKTRRGLERRVIKEDLNSFQLRRLVRQIRREPPKASPPFPPLKRPAGLKLHTFSLSPLHVKLKDGQVLIDCGFFVSWPVVKEELKKLNITQEMSYTYAATVDRIIDGDTLLALIEVGFGIIVRDRLRLRGIDTPALGTPTGERAKRFVAKLLPAGSTIVIKSHKGKTDPYGRFVADVFYQEEVEDAAVIIADGVYLNQELLDKGHAVRMAE
jgi:endonuclease YncB( thermonuclease family)